MKKVEEAIQSTESECPEELGKFNHVEKIFKPYLWHKPKYYILIGIIATSAFSSHIHLLEVWHFS